MLHWSWIISQVLSLDAGGAASMRMGVLNAGTRGSQENVVSRLELTFGVQLWCRELLLRFRALVCLCVLAASRLGVRRGGLQTRHRIWRSQTEIAHHACMAMITTSVASGFHRFARIRISCAHRFCC